MRRPEWLKIKTTQSRPGGTVLLDRAEGSNPSLDSGRGTRWTHRNFGSAAANISGAWIRLTSRLTSAVCTSIALMALMWYAATDGKGKKDMVVLPYKDRLLLFSRYLQQLVMESLGKQLDLDGRRVEQGV